MFYGFVITEAGNRLLAKMVAGQTLEITSVVMEKGTAESAEAARLLTTPIDPGPAGTSTAPMVEGSTASMMVEYRSDLDGGLAEGFWIGGFGIFAKVREEDTLPEMIYYGSLGDAKQYVSAYIEGQAPDVRRYAVAITVTAGVDVTLGYPAEAWMTSQDVAEFFSGTLKKQLEQSLTTLIEAHDTYKDAHNSIEARMQTAEAALNRISSTNLLDNWYLIPAYDEDGDMVLPVNQRNISGTFSTVGSYFIDRWVLMDGSVEITDDGLILNGTIEQRLEHSVGMETTASALSTSGPMEAEYDDTEKVFSITAAGETIIAAKLEIGKTQTLFRQEDEDWILNDPPPNIAAELAKCQRYQIEIRPTWYSSVLVTAVGPGVGTYNASIMMAPIPVTMRALPTIIHSGDWSLTLSGLGKDGIPIATIEVNYMTSTSITLTIWANTTLLSKGTMYELQSNDGNMLLDANL